MAKKRAAKKPKGENGSIRELGQIAVDSGTIQMHDCDDGLYVGTGGDGFHKLYEIKIGNRTFAAVELRWLDAVELTEPMPLEPPKPHAGFLGKASRQAIDKREGK